MAARHDDGGVWRSPPHPRTPAGHDRRDGGDAYDPLKLCVFATIASLGWLLGPVALAAFAVLGPVGYLRAWRQGLTTSKCLLRDTPLFIAYLAALAGLAVWGPVRLIA